MKCGKCAAITLAIVVLAVAFVVASLDFHGDLWQSRPAKEKLATVWSSVIENPEPASWYNAIEVGLFLFSEAMSLTFDNVGDDMPKNVIDIWPIGPVTFPIYRSKPIHTVGVVAQVSWVSNDNHNYTGLFKGAEYGLIRISAAKTPEPTSLPPNIVPGISLKFFRDRMESGNIMAMFSLAGQDSFNFFKHDFTNHAPAVWEKAPFALRKLADKFATASSWSTFIGVSSFASYNQAGVPAEPEPSFPFRLIFHPSTVYHNKFSDNPNQNYIEEIPNNLDPNTLLYEVHAQDTPESTSFNHIGDIWLTSRAVSSNFGDKSMFFQHTRFEDDLYWKASWAVPASKILQQQAQVQDYKYPDLPWR